MIVADELVPVGRINKPHGVRGEVSATLLPELSPSDLRCIILDIDGIFVPFFIDSFRVRGSESWLFTIDGVDSDEKAAKLTGHEIFALKDELPVSDDEEDGDGVYMADLIGYKVIDGDKQIGVIEDFDDSTENLLILVKDSQGKTLYIPFVDEFVADIDTESKTLEMDIPEGILDLN